MEATATEPAAGKAAPSAITLAIPTKSAQVTTPLTRHSVSARTVSTPASSLPACVDGPIIAQLGVAAHGQDGLRPDDQAAVDTKTDEHGADCGCKQCSETVAAKRIARLHQESERLFHEKFPKAKYYPDSDCEKDHHIWNNLHLQLNHLRCLPEVTQQLLKDVYRRVTYDLPSGEPGFWKRQTEYVSYHETASIIACSDYENRRNFCRCGYYGYSCRDPLCKRCCFTMRGGPAIFEFGDAFDARNEVYYIVLSLSGDLDERKRIIFKDLTKAEWEQIKARGCFEQGKQINYGIPFTEPEDLLKARIYWEQFARTIKQFTGRKKPFAAAFGGPELSVRFLPLRALPHANYVAFADAVTRDDARAMRRVLREFLRGCRRLDYRVYPKVAVYRLPSHTDLREVTDYIFKPVGIAIPYALTADKLDYQPDGMRDLNQEVNQCLDNIRYVFTGLARMNRYGVCNPSAGEANYIGTVSEERLERRANDAKNREKRSEHDKAIKEMFENYKPHKRHKSEQDKYDIFLLRAYQRKILRDGEDYDNLPTRLKQLLRRASAVDKDATGNAPVAPKQSHHDNGHPASPASISPND